MNVSYLFLTFHYGWRILLITDREQIHGKGTDHGRFLFYVSNLVLFGGVVV